MSLFDVLVRAAGDQLLQHRRNQRRGIPSSQQIRKGAPTKHIRRVLRAACEIFSRERLRSNTLGITAEQFAEDGAYN